MTFDFGLGEIMFNGGGWLPGTSLLLVACVEGARRPRLPSTLRGAGFGCSSVTACCLDSDRETVGSFRAGDAGRDRDVAAENSRLFLPASGTL